ncbi:MAG TPA: hypothetical protein VFW48_10730, partial [Solirubrobacterales bacterium]|nr:hypothetical protein [Solirubrobacterales bacterium]
SVLKLATPLGLGNPQLVHTLELSFAGCGTGSAHNNCTITVEELPLLHLLKTGLDQGVLTVLTGALRIVCANLGINCLIDLEGAELAMGEQHTTAEDVPVIELGGKFFCPGEGLLDFLLVTLENHYILK